MKHAGAQRVPVLLYHAVTDDPRPWIREFSVGPAAFAEQMRLVAESGRQVVTISQLVERRRRDLSTGREVVVTFDDGFADFAQGALPVLDSHGFVSTLYLTTGALCGGDREATSDLLETPMLAWPQLPQLEASGVEIGAHAMTHLPLDVLATSVARREIEGSKAALEKQLGHAVTTFAYPHGYAGRRIERLVSEAGFTSACAVREALSPRDDDPMRLARLTVRRTTSEAELARWLAGDGPAARSGRGRAFLWRSVRMLRPGPLVQTQQATRCRLTHPRRDRDQSNGTCCCGR